MAEMIRHPNGLISNRPDGMTARQTSDGFEITTRAKVRNPLVIRIGLAKTEGLTTLPAPAWFGLFGMRYVINASEGGSGGTSYDLTAARPTGTCWLMLAASAQSETGQPEFLPAWAVLAETSLGPGATC